jgi:hypothetical protein
VSIEKDLSEAIEKHIPGMLAARLSARLEQGEKALAREEELVAQIAGLNRKIVAQDALAAREKDVDARTAALEKRQGEVEARERNLRVEVLEIKLGAANERGVFAENLLATLARNTTVRKSVLGNTPIAADNGYVQNGSHNEDVTITEE